MAHGTVQTAWRGCGCAPCRSARATYERRRRRRQGSAMVPAADVRAKLLRLLDAGLGQVQIARLAGVSQRRIWDLVHRRTNSLRSDVAAKILAVQPDRALGAMVSSYRTRKLLEALFTEGFTKRAIAAALGVHTFPLIRGTVRVRTAKRIEALYEDWIGAPDGQDEEDVTP